MSIKIIVMLCVSRKANVGKRLTLGLTIHQVYNRINSRNLNREPDLFLAALSNAIMGVEAILTIMHGELLYLWIGRDNLVQSAQIITATCLLRNNLNTCMI